MRSRYRLHRASRAGPYPVHLSMPFACGREPDAPCVERGARRGSSARAPRPRSRSGRAGSRLSSSRRPLARTEGAIREVTVAAHHPAEVATLVLACPKRRLGERPRCPSACCPGSDAAAAPRWAGDVLPAAAGEEAVIGAGDELRAVLENHPVRGLADHPVVEHLGPHVAPVPAPPDRAVDLVPGAKMADLERPAVGHEDGSVSRNTVKASMTAAPVRVHRPAERNA